jgi:hypothetical protein
MPIWLINYSIPDFDGALNLIWEPGNAAGLYFISPDGTVQCIQNNGGTAVIARDPQGIVESRFSSLN